MNINDVINNSLFFLGAGSSREAGCLMSTQMLDSLKDIICKKSNEYFSETECETIKFLFSCLNYHSEWRLLENNNKYPVSINIEEMALLIRRIRNRENFLPYPITGNWADKLTSLEAKFKEEGEKHQTYGLFDKIEDTLKTTLLKKWLEIKSTEYLNVLDDFFEKCSNNSEDFNLEIFTLNNDLVLETHYTNKKARPYRGFVSGEWRGFNKKPNPQEFNRILLYKLHGSIDWIRLLSGNVIEESKYRDFNFEELVENKVDNFPFIIFGHGTKFFSVEPFFSLIQKFWKNLLKKRYFFIIGYSFFDPYINNLLFQAVKLSRHENKRIIIVNPSFAYPPLEEKHFENLDSRGIILSEKEISGKLLLTEYLEDIQRNRFYSELPEFNIKHIPTESIYYLKISFNEFLSMYFNNGGENIITLIESFEKDRLKELPFSK